MRINPCESRWLLVDAATGNGTEESSAENVEAGSSSGDTTEETITVRYQDYGTSLTNLPMLDAVTDGLFAEEGIELVANDPIYDSSQLLQDLTRGDVDLVVAGATSALAAADAEQDVVIVGSVTPPHLQVTLTTDAMAKLKEAGIDENSDTEDKFNALKGLTLATGQAGNQNTAMLMMALNEYGVDPNNDVVLRPFKDPTAIVAAARQKQVDGFVGSPPRTTNPDVEGWGVVFINGPEETPELIDVPGASLVTTRKYLDANRDTIDTIVSIVAQSKDKLANLDDDEVRALQSEHFPDMDTESFVRAFDAVRPLLSTSVEITSEQYDRLLSLSSEGPLASTTLKFEDVFA